MKFQQFINKELNRDTISLVEMAMFIEEYNEVNEGIGEWGKKLKSVMNKAGLHVSKGEPGLLQIITKSSTNIAKLLWYVFNYSANGNKEYKAKAKEIINKKISKEDLINFFLKLDLLTLHMITGPIHIIDALTGWHIGPKVLKGVDDLVKRGKDAINNLIHIRDKSKDRKVKDTLSSYIKRIKELVLGNKTANEI